MAIKCLIHFSLALFQEYNEGIKYAPRYMQKAMTDCGQVMLLRSVACSFENKVILNANFCSCHERRSLQMELLF